MHKRLVLQTLLACLLFCLAAPLAVPFAHAASGHGDSGPKVEAIPPDATRGQLNEILAAMDDAQVRRLLIAELEKHAAPPPPPEEKGVAAYVRKVRHGAAFVRDRFEYLFSGAAAAPREVPRALAAVLGGSGGMPPGRLLLAVVVLSALWGGSLLLFKRRTKDIRKSIAAVGEDAPWYTRMGRLFLRALLDLFGMAVFTAVVFVGYITLFDEGAAGKPVIAAWLTAMVFLELVKVAARFLLSPHAPSLRYLPLSDATAQHLFHWTVHVTRVIAVGLLLVTLLRIEGVGEATLLLITAVFGFLVAFMLVLLALWNKRPVAEALRRGCDPESLRYQFAGIWHMGAITYVLCFWMFWVVALMIFGGRAMLSGMVTLLVIPGYFLCDWVTQRLVRFAVSMAEGDPARAAGGEGGGLHIGRFERFLSRAFRVLILAAAVFILLRAWGIDLVLGREVVRAGINALITLILAYILWVSVSGLIERKLRAAGEDIDGHDGHGGEGDGHGGPGGDRFSTLLQLLRKFIFVSISVVTVLIVLSSMGVDIGPLIAGASVFGIAIGFGSQTLVKDIISGIFFLTDDAFRVGDYIETAGAMGTVEAISVRSIKLRHHLGFLYTIPFGSMKTVKNNTRDWAVMKLQYLVPFDTDLQKIKKIVKRINKEIREVPELNEFMLSDIKSQGVKAMEDYGMRMRVKFMTKPGGQFTLRKLVLAKMRNYFAEEGIEFAKPRVTVHLPDRDTAHPDDDLLAAAAATQAVSAKAGEEEEKKE